MAVCQVSLTYLSRICIKAELVSWDLYFFFFHKGNRPLQRTDSLIYCKQEAQDGVQCPVDVGRGGRGGGEFVEFVFIYS